MQIDNRIEIDKPIIIGMATIKGREEAFIKAKDSLHLSTMMSVKPSVFRSKIVFYIIDYTREYGDTGNKIPDWSDNGKYWGLSQIDYPCYYFSCDDDLIYPETYIRDMILAIQKHKCIVTHHGRKLRGVGKYYYKHHLGFGCLRNVRKEQFIDVAGTGVTAFDTEYFNPVGIHLAPEKRMSDLVFSLEATKQNKQIMLLSHSKGYIQQIPVDKSTSCFEIERKNPWRQNQIADEIFKLKYM